MEWLSKLQYLESCCTAITGGVNDLCWNIELDFRYCVQESKIPNYTDSMITTLFKLVYSRKDWSKYPRLLIVMLG